jgi:hypothetical protein
MLFMRCGDAHADIEVMYLWCAEVGLIVLVLVLAAIGNVRVVSMVLIVLGDLHKQMQREIQLASAGMLEKNTYVVALKA